LRILIAAGLFSITAKYDNAVFAVANALSGLADVCVLSISRFPLPRLRLPETTFDVVEPRFSWLLLMQCIRNFGDARHVVSRYTTTHSWFGFLSLVRYLMNYSQLELTLKTYRPDVVHIHSSDLERSAYIQYLLSCTDVPFLLTVHGLYSLDPNLQTRYDANALERHLLRRLSEKGIFITFVSSGIKQAAVQRFAIADSRLTVVPNGVDIDRFRPVPQSQKDAIRMKYGIPLQRKVLIQVGELYRLKNHMFVLRCLASLDSRLRQKLHYVIVGDGAEKATLIRFCRENQLMNRCTFVGRRYATELVELYEASDLLVVPSTSEAFPLVMLEAMATGIPILTFSDLWPIKDIANRVNTILVHQRTAESFKDALARAIQQSWSQSEIRRFAEQFTWPIVAKRYYALYSQIIGQSVTRVAANNSVAGSVSDVAGVPGR